MLHLPFKRHIRSTHNSRLKFEMGDGKPPGDLWVLYRFASSDNMVLPNRELGKNFVFLYYCFPLILLNPDKEIN